jgi:hypothetical protein
MVKIASRSTLGNRFLAYYAYQANYTMSNETPSYQLALNLVIKWRTV